MFCNVKWEISIIMKNHVDLMVKVKPYVYIVAGPLPQSYIFLYTYESRLYIPKNQVKIF